ncbi:hypothetical protein CTA2_10274 [Colletotrichum tanaceti]|uniref:GPI anchored serine-rich protein n=1 Tax=Colletotrichum tanaceti TaxID=1306861 RepID=A0A4U6XQL3_9PEZI|nr:hypothetical protein CTA2_10274 [Colletotrichum tanaceti]TKW58082.1 hypothetical protein CTA1_11119 [Colletotrichum tanaceti]
MIRCRLNTFALLINKLQASFSRNPPSSPPPPFKMRYTTAALALAGAVVAYYDEEPASTVFSTKYFTITSCAPEVTNCPARSTVVSSSVVPMTTSTIVPMTTSTIYTTKITTVTSCAPEITNCPAGSTVVVTKTEAVSTTVCPVSEIDAKPSPTAPGVVPPPVGHNNATVPGVPIKSGAVPPVQPHSESGVKPVPVPVPTGGVAPSVSMPAALATSPAPECPGYSVKTISTSVTTVVPTVIYETVKIPCPTPSKPSATIPGVPTGGNGTALPPTRTPVTAGAAGLTGSAVLAAIAGVAAFAFA